LIFKLAKALEAPELFVAAGFLTPFELTTETLDKRDFDPLYDDEEIFRLEADPMLEYARLAKPSEDVRNFTYSAWSDLVSAIPLWCARTIPAVRETIAKALERWEVRKAAQAKQILEEEPDPKQQRKRLFALEDEDEYIVGYQAGAKRILETLSTLLHTHIDGLYWILAAVGMPPEEARALADMYEDLKAVNFNPDVVTTITDLLRLWRQRHEAKTQEISSGTDAAKETKRRPGA
jgi:hypothetical protein